jgi:EAL domain-containing protein (putative c-di-GMP-specific phosphodiesterase class I)
MTLLPNQMPHPLPEGLPPGLIRPYYQPIIAMDTGLIAGYEVLGRLVNNGVARSLGPFFADSSVPRDEHLKVDGYIREAAIGRIGREEMPPLLFLNFKPEWLYHTGASGELQMLALLEKYRLPPNRIVIEITEESFNGPMDTLRGVIDRYRANGCQIAIDDVGIGFSSMDRIAQIQPNLLKIDMHMVKKSGTHNGYFGVLRSFSELAEQIGASLLFEGVETKEDLERAIQAGARYVQGFLFAKAEPELLPPEAFAPFVEAELASNLKRHVIKERHWHDHAEKIADQLMDMTGREDVVADTDEWLERLLPDLDESCIRAYICNGDGIQLSANFCRGTNGGWLREEQFRHVNWSWRPYYIPNLVQLNHRRRSIVSRAYTDLDTHEWIRTISVLVRDGVILFVDSTDNPE